MTSEPAQGERSENTYILCIITFPGNEKISCKPLGSYELYWRGYGILSVFWEYMPSDTENILTPSPKSTSETKAKYLPVLHSPLPTFNEIDILTAN